MTTFSHLDQAVEALEEATLHFADAVKSGEFAHYHVWYLDRLDLLKRATANLRSKMQEAGAEDQQEELRFV
jgi:hypothetical protein